MERQAVNLGEELFKHPYVQAFRWGAFLLSLVSAALGLLLVGLPFKDLLSGGEMAALGSVAIAVACGLVFLLPGLGYAWGVFRSHREAPVVVVHEGGVRYLARSKAHSWAWDEVSGIVVVNTVADDNPQWIKKREVDIRSGAQSFQLSSETHGNVTAETVLALQNRHAEVWLPRYQEILDRGESIRFSNLWVNKQGIAHGDVTRAWSDVASWKSLGIALEIRFHDGERWEVFVIGQGAENHHLLGPLLEAHLSDVDGGDR